MTREEFVTLPPRIALGLVYDMARPRLENVPRPDVPKSPLYDGRLSKGNDGFVWMSEMLLRDLEWWRNAKQKTADEGGKYADQARKAVATLQKWIAWRLLYPSDIWSGKRGDDRATGAPPSRDPRVNPWPAKNDKKPETKSSNPENGDYGF